MLIKESEPAPLVAVARFLNQSGSAIVFEEQAQAPLILVGVRIEQATHASAAAIRGGSGLAISAIDTVIQCNGQGVAIESSASIHMKSVYTEGSQPQSQRFP